MSCDIHCYYSFQLYVAEIAQLLKLVAVQYNCSFISNGRVSVSLFLHYFIMWSDPYFWWFDGLQRECHRASPEIQEGQKSSSWFYTFRELNQESCNATWCSYTGWCGSRSSQCWLCPQLCKKELVEFSLLPCLSVTILLFLFVLVFLVLILTSFNAGTMLELSEAIRDYHDHTGLPQMVC